MKTDANLHSFAIRSKFSGIKNMIFSHSLTLFYVYVHNFTIKMPPLAISMEH